MVLAARWYILSVATLFWAGHHLWSIHCSLAGVAERKPLGHGRTWRRSLLALDGLSRAWLQLLPPPCVEETTAPTLRAKYALEHAGVPVLWEHGVERLRLPLGIKPLDNAAGSPPSENRLETLKPARWVSARSVLTEPIVEARRGIHDRHGVWPRGRDGSEGKARRI